MAFVEPPVALDRDPVAVRPIQSEIRSRNRAPEERGVCDIGQQPRLTQQISATQRLLHALVRESHIDPAREQVGSVPFALTVAKENQRVCHAFILPYSSTPARAPFSPVTRWRPR